MKFVLSNIEGIEDDTPGLYAFWMWVEANCWSCIYIGEAKCLRKRLLSHWKNEYSAGAKLAAHKRVYGRYYQFCYYRFSPDEQKRRLLEKKLINQWQPRKNTIRK